MEQITVREILEATGGKLLCGSLTTPLTHISIDSRVMKGNDLFVPLLGEKADAHDFIQMALNNGAAATLTAEHDSMESDQAWIQVDNTKTALQKIGLYYRKRLSIPLIGITGSVGKTTTREMVATALGAGFHVFKTPGNHNSQVGVPITLSEIGKQDEIGVIELGMSEPGELTVIAQIAQIDMAVITNIGVTHMEQLGSKENIYHEKLTIQDGLRTGGTLFLNGDDELLKDTKGRAGFRTFYYGTGENSDYRAEEIHLENGYPSFIAVHGSERITVHLKVMGFHNVLNAMAALAVANEYRIPMSLAVKQLETFTGFQSRQQIYQSHGVTIIDDTYNASPVSMKAGLNVLASMQQNTRRIAVLADMKELGAEANKLHYEIGTYIAQIQIDEVVTLGELSEEICHGIMDTDIDFKIQVHHFSEKTALEAYLESHFEPGDCVLFKGSNSMKLGEIASGFIGQ